MITMTKPVILTGIRSNGELTLGNYLGAIVPLIKLQRKHVKDYQINMFVPDLHSFTTPIDHSLLYQNTLNNLKVFIAAGLNVDAQDSYIYRQSYISAHSELTWILDNFTHYGELSRMIQFKDKSKQNQVVSAGLFNYPVLMAADILLYDAKFVPVGEDQRQHLELSRDLAIRINHQFNKELFVIPETWDKQIAFAELDQGVKIRSLSHPESKMSKSVSDPSGTILLSDSSEEINNKIIAATTDSVGVINYDFKNQPGISNLLQIIAIGSNRPLSDVINEWQGRSNYKGLKETTSEVVVTLMSKFKQSLSNISQNDILKVLNKDEEQIRKIANQKLEKVQISVGLRP